MDAEQFLSIIRIGGYHERRVDIDSDEWFIINVGKARQGGEDVWNPLNDGALDGGNSQTDFAEAVNEVRSAVQSEEAVFVHCAVGQSRSVSIVATALGAEAGIEYPEALEYIMDASGNEYTPADSLSAKGESYLRHYHAKSDDSN